MNYYNENDRHAAAWLRELINQKQIPKGEVDERSITEVKASDLTGFTQFHFFAGIGGWSYALRLAEWSEDRQVWTGSCPCQPLSCAGQRKGHADERHLWPAFYALIAECKPSVVFGEQVASKDGREWLAGVRADLEGAGYALGCADLCAASVSAPHRRQRLYWVANDQRSGWQERQRGEGMSAEARLQQRSDSGGCSDFDVLADNEREGLERHAGNVRNGNKPGRIRSEQTRSASESCSVNGMAHTGHETGRTEQGFKLSGEDCGIRESGARLLADSNVRNKGNGELQRSRQYGQQLENSGVSFWSRFQIVQCRDGKARRFEPESFPLVDGIPGRVALLRGYGNAIVPQVAAKFIEAFTDLKCS